MISPHDRYSAIEYLKKAIEVVSSLPTTTPCQNCLHLSAGYCNLWKSVVPNDILPKGCEKWDFDRLSPVS